MNKNKVYKNRRKMGFGCLLAGGLLLAGAPLGMMTLNNIINGSSYMKKIDIDEYSPVTIQDIQSNPEMYHLKLVEIVDPVWRKFIPIKGRADNFIDRSCLSPDIRYNSLEFRIIAGIVPQGTILNPLNPYEENISCIFTTDTNIPEQYKRVVDKINLNIATNPEFTDHTVLRGIVRTANDGSPVIYGHSITIDEDTYHLSDLFYGQSRR